AYSLSLIQLLQEVSLVCLQPTHSVSPVTSASGALAARGLDPTGSETSEDPLSEPKKVEAK
ncbi:Small integral membrane protein 13, partial [Clarias magur]